LKRRTPQAAQDATTSASSWWLSRCAVKHTLTVSSPAIARRIAATDRPYRPVHRRARSWVASVPSMLICKRSMSSSRRRRTVSSSIVDPLDPTPIRMPRARACAITSNRSRLTSGSPPETATSSTPNAASSSNRWIASSVVSSFGLHLSASEEQCTQRALHALVASQTM
jgi:hypothetical protein